FSSANADDAALKQVAGAFVQGLTSCDVDTFSSLFHEDHRGFLIKDDENDTFADLRRAQQCKDGFRLKILSKTITVEDLGDGFGTALIDVRALLMVPGVAITDHRLRASLALQDHGNGPEIMRSHVSALPDPDKGD
ncbi:MAG: hypothetical protein HRU11_15255, partial [Parvularculaceae bacterium]|nr:hypothetical protein [Parvularculaceae bacterium]